MALSVSGTPPMLTSHGLGLQPEAASSAAASREPPLVHNAPSTPLAQQPAETVTTLSKEDVFKTAIVAGPIIAAGVLMIGTAFMIASVAQLIFFQRSDFSYHSAENVAKDLEYAKTVEAARKKEFDAAQHRLQELSEKLSPVKTGIPAHLALAIRVINGVTTLEDQDEELTTEDEQTIIRRCQELLAKYETRLNQNPMHYQQAQAFVVARELIHQLDFALTAEQKEILAFELAKQWLQTLHQKSLQQLHLDPLTKEDEEWDTFQSWFDRDCEAADSAGDDIASYVKQAPMTPFAMALEPSPLTGRVVRRKSAVAGTMMTPRRLSFDDDLETTPLSRSTPTQEPRTTPRPRSLSLIPRELPLPELEAEDKSKAEDKLDAQKEVLERIHKQQMEDLILNHKWELNTLAQNSNKGFQERVRAMESAVQTAQRQLDEASGRVAKLTALLNQCQAYQKARSDLIVYAVSMVYGSALLVPVVGSAALIAHDGSLIASQHKKMLSTSTRTHKI